MHPLITQAMKALRVLALTEGDWETAKETDENIIIQII